MSAMMMWVLSGSGTRVFGVLPDGSMFQHLPESGWSTIVGPQPENDAIDFALEITTIVESQGAVMTLPPTEFTMADDVVSAIRSDSDWERVGPLLFEALAE